MSNIAIYIGEDYSWVKMQKTRGTVIRDPNELVKWVKNNPGHYLIFGTDIIPEQSPILDFLNNGGKVIWIGDEPHLPVPNGFHYSNPKPVRNTLIGDILEYKPKESQISVDNKDVLPIALNSNYQSSAWIYRMNKGYFIRLFDTPNISDKDEEYITEFPEKFEKLFNVNAIKLNNFRLFDNVSINLGKTNVFIGDNGSGKTTVLESIAVMLGHLDEIIDNRNIKDHNIVMATLRKNYYKEYSIEGIFNTKYLLNLDGVRFFKQPIKVMHFIPELLPKYEKKVINEINNLKNFTSMHKEVSESLKAIDSSFEDIAPYQDQLVIEKNDKTLIRLNDLGKGLSSLIILSLIIILKKPEILLIDNVDAMGLSPLRIETLKAILDKSNSMTLFTTQSMDIIAVFCKDDNVKFHLMSEGKINTLNANEVRVLFESNEDIRLIANET